MLLASTVSVPAQQGRPSGDVGEGVENSCGCRRNSSCPCAADEAGDRCGDSACVGGAHERPNLRLVPEERVQQRFAEQMVEVPFPQEVVEEFKTCATGAIFVKNP